MDVTCDRCGTEYEFEETLVSPRGTTVKCTQCGHLFKVYRPQAALNSQLVGGHWTVRRVDGSSHQLPSLTELTRFIAEASFARDDEVSRTGRAWRRLGDVEELEPFFAEADRRGPSRARKATHSPVLGLSQPKQPADSAERTAPRSAASAAVGGEPITRADDDDEDIATQQVPLAPRTAATGHAALVSAAPGASTAQSGEPAALEPNRARTAPLRAAEPARAATPIEFPSDLEDRSGVEPPARGSIWLWVFAVLSTGLAVSTWLLWPAPPSQSKSQAPEDRSAQFLARADSAFGRHRSEQFEDAITDYIKTLAFHESDPHVLSSLSRVYAVWAQEILFSIPAAQRKNDTNKSSAAAAQSAATSTRAQQLSEQAKLYAETAARKNPGDSEAEVALSDALRLTGNLVAARSELDRARASERNASAETLRVAALLAIDEAGGDARAGLTLAAQAVAKDPELMRTQLLLARCLIADHDLQGARHHLQLVLTRDRDLPSAHTVEELLEHADDPSSTRDAAVPEAAKSASDAATPQFENLSHEGYISRGGALLEAGQVSAAKRMFEQALFIRPNSSQAHAGLGYVALEKGRPQLAAEHFVAATRVGNDDALIGLADAYRRMSRPRDALRAYQNYLSHNPNGKHASIAQAQVERLSEDAARTRKTP
jgi:predicted Zn finger-like uncharacterized protein